MTFGTINSEAGRHSGKNAFLSLLIFLSFSSMWSHVKAGSLNFHGELIPRLKVPCVGHRVALRSNQIKHSYWTLFSKLRSRS